MNNRAPHPLKRALASTLAASLILFSSGLGPYEAAARVITQVVPVQTGIGAAGGAGVAAVQGLSNGPSSVSMPAGLRTGAALPTLHLPTLSHAPSLRTPGVSAAALPSVAEAAPVSISLRGRVAAAPSRGIVAGRASKPASLISRTLSQRGRFASIAAGIKDAPVEGARGAGRGIFDLLLGRRSIKGASLDTAIPATGGLGALTQGRSLSPSSRIASVSSSDKGVPAPSAARTRGRTALKWLAKAGLMGAGLLGIGSFYGYLMSGLASGPGTLVFAIYAGTMMFWSILSSICGHEAAHAWTAEKVGDVSARMAGQISLNPLRYMNAMSATMLFFTSLFGIPFGFFFAVMQNKLVAPEHKGKMAKVALAGPVMNLIITAALIGLIIGVKSLAPGLAAMPWIGGTLRILGFASMINLLLGASNLIPLGPLDGQKVARAAVPNKWIGWFDKITIGVGLAIMLGGLAYLVLSRFLMPGLPGGGGGAGIISQTGNPLIMTMVAFGFLIWVASLIPWIRTKVAGLRDFLLRERIMYSGGYEITLTYSRLANKNPVRAAVERPVAVPWSGAADAARPGGKYSLDPNVDGSADDFVLGQQALVLDNGETAALDKAHLSRVRKGEYLLLRRHADDLQGPAYALLPAAGLGGAEAARRLRETNAAAKAVGYGLEGREILTSGQVRVVRRLSKELGAPVYELALSEKQPPSRETAILADTIHGPAFFVALSVIEGLAAAAPEDREAALKSVVEKLGALRK